MRSGWIVLGAIVIGLAGAVASAADDPLPPKNLAIQGLGEGAAVSFDAAQWSPVSEGFAWSGLTLLHATYVRGPARIDVVAGTWVEVPAGSVVLVTWEPAVRGWRFVPTTGDVSAHFPNTGYTLAQGHSMTLTSGGDVYRGPSGYSPSPVTGLEGLPEVSGFRPFELDIK